MKTEQDIRDSLAVAGIPANTHDGVVRYLLHGVRPGSFLLALFANDFVACCLRADDKNNGALRDWAVWIINHAPASCHGSHLAIDRWCAARQAERKQEVQS